MRLSFVHQDGRLEPAADGAVLQAVGGFAAHPSEVVDKVLQATADLDIELWATWHMNRLPPPLHSHTVLLVIGDEAGQIPAYASRFLCTFSNGSRGLGCAPRPISTGSAYVAALECARGARNLARRIERRIKVGAPLSPGSNLYSFPLGAAEFEVSEATRPRPPSERDIDILFLGSIGRTAASPFGEGRIGLSAKAAARLSAASGLARAARAQSSMSILMGCADHPQFGPALPGPEYRQALGSSKICFCPRGNFAETFRHAEAARAGCVVFTDRLPDEWYFTDHPFVIVDDWSKALDAARALLSKPEAMARLASASRQWYETMCSPPAVSAFVVSRIRAHLAIKAGEA